MTALFTIDDWQSLTPPQKKALRKFSRVAIDFEPLAKAAGVGQSSMDSLIAIGLAEEGEASLHGRTFRLTDKGWLAVEWLNGNRVTSVPE